MKKFLRLILDLIIAAGLVAAFIMGIVALTGSLSDWKDLGDKLSSVDPSKVVDSMTNASTYYWLAMSGIIVAGLAAIPTAISIVFFFRHRDNWGWTIFSMLLMIAAVVLTAIAAHHNDTLSSLANLLP